MPTDRDPRKEPKKGDVIRLRHDYRSRKIADVGERPHDSVLLYGMDRGRDIPMSYCSLSMWPELAADAEVISIAE